MLFTVIIATCNRQERLAAGLEAVGISIESAGGGHSIVVVDNGLQESAENVVSTFQKKSGLDVKCLRSEPGDKSRALNAGIKIAQTEWLAFTDDDAIPAPGWLKAAVEYAGSSGVSIFGGRVTAGEIGDARPSWLRPGKSGRVPKGPAIVDYAPLPAGGVIGENQQVPLGANIFVKKSIFEKYGGYDEKLWARCGKAALGSEDAEFAMRVRSVGERIGYCAEAVVVHPVYPDRATPGFHLAWAYRMGLRETVLFPEERNRAGSAYWIKMLAGSLFKSVGNLSAGDKAGSMCDLMAAANAAGQIAGRMRRV